MSASRHAYGVFVNGKAHGCEYHSTLVYTWADSTKPAVFGSKKAAEAEADIYRPRFPELTYEVIQLR